MKRAAVFVDVQNIYYTTRQAFGQQFDYRALWQELSSRWQIDVAIAYAVEGDEKQQRFQFALRKIGFEVKLKPYIQRKDGTAKADWDVGITLDMMDIAPKVDTVVLLSGDGDFDLLLAKVRERFENEAVVYGVPPLTARSLVNAASEFRAIDSSLLLS